MKMKFNIALFLLMLWVGMYFVIATPEGPSTLRVDNSTRRTVNTYNVTDAIAGNVTQLTIVGTSISQSWQGYYGNITGTLSLETSNGYRMYTWTVPNPKGEIYATESDTVPRWGGTGLASSISCWNYSNELGQANKDYVSYSELEGWDPNPGDAGESFTFDPKGIKKSAVDSVNNTFLTTSARAFPSFYAGTKFINGTRNTDMCPSLALYNSTSEITYAGSTDADTTPTAADGSVIGGKYQEVILWDNTSKSILFTAIIDFERNVPGFDGRIWDFEMIVPEKGASGDVDLTLYNFYVELE